MDLMRYQVMAHTAVQENDIDVLLYCWKKFLPMYFSLNKLHYRGKLRLAYYFQILTLEQLDGCEVEYQKDITYIVFLSE